MSATIEALGDDAFGHWLAGFFDGEASFLIQRRTGPYQYAYMTRMQLLLRDDDAPLLVSVRKRTGVGRLYDEKRPAGRKGNPGVKWIVSSKADCAALVLILDRYPLVSKKARDYAIWRRAVELCAPARAVGPNRHDYSEIARLKQELESGRVYRPRPLDLAA